MLKFDEKSERAEEMSEEEFFSGEAQSTWQVIWKRFMQHKLARIGMVIMAVLILAAVFAPFIAKFDPTELHLEDVPDGIALGPSAKYWFGTDTHLARLLFTRALRRTHQPSGRLRVGGDIPADRRASRLPCRLLRRLGGFPYNAIH